MLTHYKETTLPMLNSVQQPPQLDEATGSELHGLSIAGLGDEVLSMATDQAGGIYYMTNPAVVGDSTTLITVRSYDYRRARSLWSVDVEVRACRSCFDSAAIKVDEARQQLLVLLNTKNATQLRVNHSVIDQTLNDSLLISLRIADGVLLDVRSLVTYVLWHTVLFDNMIVLGSQEQRGKLAVTAITNEGSSLPQWELTLHSTAVSLKFFSEAYYHFPESSFHVGVNVGAHPDQQNGTLTIELYCSPSGQREIASLLTLAIESVVLIKLVAANPDTDCPSLDELKVVIFGSSGFAGLGLSSTRNKLIISGSYSPMAWEETAKVVVVDAFFDLHTFSTPSCAPAGCFSAAAFLDVETHRMSLLSCPSGRVDLITVGGNPGGNLVFAYVDADCPGRSLYLNFGPHSTARWPSDATRALAIVTLDMEAYQLKDVRWLTEQMGTEEPLPLSIAPHFIGLLLLPPHRSVVLSEDFNNAPSVVTGFLLTTSLFSFPLTRSAESIHELTAADVSLNMHAVVSTYETGPGEVSIKATDEKEFSLLWLRTFRVEGLSPGSFLWRSTSLAWLGASIFVHFTTNHTLDSVSVKVTDGLYVQINVASKDNTEFSGLIPTHVVVELDIISGLARSTNVWNSCRECTVEVKPYGIRTAVVFVHNEEAIDVGTIFRGTITWHTVEAAAGPNASLSTCVSPNGVIIATVTDALALGNSEVSLYRLIWNHNATLGTVWSFAEELPDVEVHNLHCLDETIVLHLSTSAQLSLQDNTLMSINNSSKLTPSLYFIVLDSVHGLPLDLTPV